MGAESQAAEVRAALDDPRRLCEALDLVGGRYGRDWSRQARGLLVRCPAHDERTASCSVYSASDGTVAVRCHGCGWTGDALSLVAKVLGLDQRSDFAEVLREGAAIAGIRLAEHQGWTPRPRPAPRPAPEASPALDDGTFDRLARELLARCPAELDRDAREYLEARGLPVPARGWACLPFDEGSLRALRDALVAELGEEAWTRSGLSSSRGWWVWQAHRLVLPWRDRSGRIVTLQRRVLGNPPEGVGKYIFATGRSPRLPYGLEDFDQTDAGAPVAFVEGALDVVALRELLRRESIARELAGRRPARWAVLGLPGVQNWRREWASLARGRRALVAFDKDRAGEAKVAEVLRDLRAAGALGVERTRPKGEAKDWAEVLQAAPPAPRCREPGEDDDLESEAEDNEGSVSWSL